MTDALTKEISTASEQGNGGKKLDIKTHFAEVSGQVAANLTSVTASFDELQGAAGSVDIGPEAGEMSQLHQEQTALTARTAKALGITSETTVLDTQAPLTAIAQLMEQPTSKHLAKTEGSHKTSRYLEREGRKWQDGIQVLQYKDDATSSNRAEINNFGLETDENGQIIERRSLNIKTDGTAELVLMQKKGNKWVGERQPASAADIATAVDAMNTLQKAAVNEAGDEPAAKPESGGVAQPIEEGGAYKGLEQPLPTPVKISDGAPPQPPENPGQLEQGENPERQGQIRLFAIDFLMRLNPEVRRDEIMQRLFSDGKDIFDGLPDKDMTRLENLRYLEDVYKLAKHYEQNDEIVPQRTVVLGTREQPEGPFDDKVLVFVEETFLDYSKIDRMLGRDRSNSLDDLYTTLPRPADDAFDFQGGEGKRRPDVYLKEISDNTVAENSKWEKVKTRAKMKRVRKKSFSISGAESVIIGGDIQPTIPHVDISCFGDVTILPDAKLLSAPAQWQTNITINAGRNIVVPEGSQLSASSLKCDTFVYQGELLNPHKDSKRVEINANKFEDSHDRPLNPQLFHINDEAYVARQEALWGVMHEARLGTSNELVAMDRSEQVANFALNLLCILNRKFSPAERDRIAVELFGRGADGTLDKSIFAGTLEENIAQWDTDQKKKEALKVESLTRGVADMLKLVEYYKQHPDVELPEQIVVVGNDKIQLDPKKKSLIFWQESWTEMSEEAHYMEALGKKFHYAVPAPKYYDLSRDRKDGYSFDGEKRPDVYLKHTGFKDEFTLTGCENIMVEGDVDVRDKLRINCSGDLTIAKGAALVSSTGLFDSIYKKKLHRVVNSSIQAGTINQGGDLSAAIIKCKEFNHTGGLLKKPAFDMTLPGGKSVYLTTETYTGEPPSPYYVELVTAETSRNS